MLIKREQRGAGFFLFLVFLLSACDNKTLEKQHYPFLYEGGTMGTSFSIKASSLPDKLNSTQLQRDIDALLTRINGQMSTYLDDSELSRLNHNPSTEWQGISEALFQVLFEANKISLLSKGAFDITVGPLVNLWGFGPDPMTYKPPTDTEIQEQLNLIGYLYLKLRENPFMIKKGLPELYLDLSALAKGYAVDQVAEMLEIQGITDYMVEIGGELRLKGSSITGKKWRIAIEKPTPEFRAIQTVLPITNISIATSGDYRNYFETDGIRFSHTIDPRNGRPITHNLASVTILSDTAMQADALATALMVLGPDQGFELAEQEMIAAFFIIKSDDGFVEKSTSAYREKTR
jgi:FAD:protein FMN transferase